MSSFPHKFTTYIDDKHKQRLLTLFIFVLVILCLLLATRSGSRRNQTSERVDHAQVQLELDIPTMTSTKWWIKITPTSPSSSTLAVQTNSVEFHTGNCPQGYTTPLKAETYAYISVAPPLPNRIRSDASQSSEYRGQIGPGDGLKVIDGPVCTDGYSWWLVESLDKRLRGWTIEGKSAQQWVIPCPNVDLQCSFIPTPTSSSLSSKVDKNKDQSENNCRSNKLAVGMYAEVDQDSLLVIRAEPHIGTILGHAGPMSIIRIVEGPSCAAGTVWWKVNAVGVGIVGWTTENYLEPCPKDNKCNLEPF